MELDRRDIPMNKLVVAGLESKFSVYNMRTQHPTKGFARLTETVSYKGYTFYRTSLFLPPSLPHNSLSSPSLPPYSLSLSSSLLPSLSTYPLPPSLLPSQSIYSLPPSQPTPFLSPNLLCFSLSAPPPPLFLPRLTRAPLCGVCAICHRTETSS